MKVKHYVATRTLLATLLLGLVPLSASAAGLCYDPGTHSMVPCGGSVVDDSVAAAVEDSVRNTTQQAVDAAVQSAADAANEAVKSAVIEESAPPADTPTPAAQPTVRSLDDFFANIDYFLNLPADSELVKKMCGCDANTWNTNKGMLKTDAALWSSGMTPRDVARAEDRMQSIKSDNRGKRYWISWSLPSPSHALDQMMRTLGVPLSSTGWGPLGLSAYQEHMQKQFEAAGGKYPW